MSDRRGFQRQKWAVGYDTRPAGQYGGKGFSIKGGWFGDASWELGVALGISEYGLRVGLNLGRLRFATSAKWRLSHD